MKYEINQFRWDTEDGFRFYHLANSRDFEVKREIPETSYSKNGSYFIIRKVDDEVQTKQRTRKSRKSN